MNLITPLAFLFALLAIPIILLYLLRLQRREQTVSSTLLWRQVVLDREANTLWQRLRRNLLLFLQLLTLAFLVFALIRPYFNVSVALSGQLVVLLDGSASMRATDVAPNRFETARAEVRRMIDELGANSLMTIILVDGSPRALIAATSNKTDLLAALNEAQPSISPANWSAGVALASSAVGITSGEGDSTTIVVSDGSNAEDLRLLNGNTRYIPIGATGDNIAISILSLRKTARGMAVFVRVINTGTADDRVLVSLRSEGVLLDARTLNVPAGGSAGWTVSGLDPRITWVRASIDQAAHNSLELDDVTYVVNPPGTARRALLLSRGNRFLEQALAVLPDLQITRAITPPAETDGRPYDMYVLDGLSMTLPAKANVLFLGAQNTFTTSGIFSNTAFVRFEPHPSLDAVDWRTVTVADAWRLNAPAWLRPIVESQGGPLLFAGEMPGDNSTFGRVVLLPFELRRTDLPLQVAFPLLIANSVQWLSPLQGLNIPASVRPGEVVPLPRDAIVRLPNGARVSVDQRGFALTTELGVYSVQNKDVTGAFAVSFNNQAESSIAPNANLVIGGAQAKTAARDQFAQREVWNWLAMIALILLMVEWWIYQRGVPTLRRMR